MEHETVERSENDKNENQKEHHPSMPVLRARDIRFHLDPLGLDDLKNFKFARFGLRLAILLLILMGAVEFCFLAALLIRLLF